MSLIIQDLHVSIAEREIVRGLSLEVEQGKVPIFEPGLPALIAKNVAAGRLRFTTERLLISARPMRCPGRLFLPVIDRRD